MSHLDFMLKLAELNLELSKAVIINNYSDIEHYSIKIGKFIQRYLNDNKMLVEKPG